MRIIPQGYFLSTGDIAGGGRLRFAEPLRRCGCRPRNFHEYTKDCRAQFVYLCPHSWTAAGAPCETQTGPLLPGNGPGVFQIARPTGLIGFGLKKPSSKSQYLHQGRPHQHDQNCREHQKRHAERQKQPLLEALSLRSFAGAENPVLREPGGADQDQRHDS